LAGGIGTGHRSQSEGTAKNSAGDDADPGGHYCFPFIDECTICLKDWVV
jgi:hypothetical protein